MDTSNFITIFLSVILGGIISGIISPIIVSYFSHKKIWKSQRRIEIKYKIFNDSLKALSMKLVDLTDPGLQSDKQSFNGAQRKDEYRYETLVNLKLSRALIKAFFDEDSYNAFDKAEKVNVKMDEGHEEFEEKLEILITNISKELKLI